MTVPELAEYLKMAPSTVYRLARHGEVPGRKIGGAWRFSRRVIDTWLREQEGIGPDHQDVTTSKEQQP